MGRYKIVDDNGIYFTTHTIVAWLPVFKERKYFEIVTQSLNHCQEKKGLTIFGYVIMLTHFYLVAQTEDGIKFHDVMGEAGGPQIPHGQIRPDALSAAGRSYKEEKIAVGREKSFYAIREAKGVFF